MDTNIITEEKIRNITSIIDYLSMKKWYAVYTRSKCEKKVSQYLSRKKIENYLPVNRIIKNQNNERDKITHEILFDSFVFVQIQEDELHIILHQSDVINFVYWLGNPAVFSEKEIHSIRNFLSHHCNIKIEKIKVNKEQELLFISRSNFINSSGNNDLMTNNSQIRLELPSLGYILIADTHSFNSDLFEQTGKIIEMVL